MNNNVPFINVEYIFNKIYDGLVFIKNLVIAILFPGGGNAPHAFSLIGSWLVTIMTFLLFGFIVWAIYIRVRIYEIDEALDGAYKGHFIKPVENMAQVNTRWQEILNHFNSTNPNDWRVAILDADTMLDELVTSLGYTGEGLGAKLTSIRLQDFPTLQIAWEAHKVRNIIAHEGANYNLTERQKELTRKNFEAVFKNAGVI